MSPELDKKLVANFPRLYRDRNKSMTQTAMCWGFDCGDGWFELLWELSEKLEKEIKEFEDKHPMTKCSCCGCKKAWHYGYLSYSPGKCLRVKKKPKFDLRLKHYKVKNKVLRNVVKSFTRTVDFFLYDYETCWCDKYDPSVPRACQVKEKCGELRFYMTTGTEKIYDIIQEYENKSEKICEACGSDKNVSQTVGWVYTRCKDCLDKMGINQ